MEPDKSSNPNEANALRDYRIGKLEETQKEVIVRVGGLELWKAKVEDIIKGKSGNQPTTFDNPSGKDWVKIVIMALTIIGSLVALLTQVLK